MCWRVCGCRRQWLADTEWNRTQQSIFTHIALSPNVDKRNKELLNVVQTGKSNKAMDGRCHYTANSLNARMMMCRRLFYFPVDTWKLFLLLEAVSLHPRKGFNRLKGSIKIQPSAFSLHEEQTTWLVKRIKCNTKSLTTYPRWHDSINYKRSLLVTGYWRYCALAWVALVWTYKRITLTLEIMEKAVIEVKL